MDTKPTEKKVKTSRRDFIRASSMIVAGGAVSSGLSIAQAAHPFGSDTIKVGLIGCGSRGTGATQQAMNTIGGEVQLVAMADVFMNRLQGAYRGIKGQHPGKINVPDERKFIGLTAYKDLLDCDLDMVLLATPPGFRPLHFEAAVKAGKHVFMEKPVAVDAPGVRRVLEANKIAKEKKLAVAVGLQRRHEVLYKEIMARLHDGAIGDIVLGRAYWTGGGVWHKLRQEKQTELEYQLRNWYYFNWLCGDHIDEQHIHNLDVINWLMKGFPVMAQGQGGRQVRKGKEFGQIFDHHMVEFTYANGTKMLSQCRHIKNCWNSVSEHAHGTKGFADISAGKIYKPNGDIAFQSRGNRDGHQQEHHDLFASIRKGERPNEAEYGAKSSMTAVLGRMATYSGQQVTWEAAINSPHKLADVDSLIALESTAPLKPDDRGRYAIPKPGETKPLEA